MDAHAATARAKKIAEDYADKVWNEKDLRFVDKYIVPETVIHSLLGEFHGPQAMKEVAQAWLTGFPDMRLHNDCIIAEHDKVVIQWRVQATHRGEFKGHKPSGKAVHYSGVTIYRIDNDKIVEYWAYIDMQYLLKQISPAI